MTLHGQIHDLKAFLDAQGMDFLVVGGLAVQYHGYSRGTLDIDLMTVVPDDFAFADNMRAAGFTYYSILPSVIFGQKPGWPQRVDFIKVNAATFAKLRDGAVEVDIQGTTVKVPSLPHLIAMKFHAYKQAGERRNKDLKDIVWLSVLNDLDPERDLRGAALQYADEDVYRSVARGIRELRGAK